MVLFSINACSANVKLDIKKKQMDISQNRYSYVPEKVYIKGVVVIDRMLDFSTKC